MCYWYYFVLLVLALLNQCTSALSNSTFFLKTIDKLERILYTKQCKEKTYTYHHLMGRKKSPLLNIISKAYLSCIESSNIVSDNANLFLMFFCIIFLFSINSYNSLYIVYICIYRSILVVGCRWNRCSVF